MNIISCSCPQCRSGRHTSRRAHIRKVRRKAKLLLRAGKDMPTKASVGYTD